MAMDWDAEMQRALEADGEKLRQLTGEDHGPWFITDEPYNGQAPCPHCFESSGYAERWNPHTWDDPGFFDADPTRPCPHCDGTGSVECEPITLHDLDEMTGEPS
jgi:hypothetical protein